MSASPPLQFSEQPGCWERHLQRQYQNPLFGHKNITQTDIAQAQKRDQQERLNFQQGFYTLLTDAASLAAEVDVEAMFKLQDRIDALYEQCAGLGGHFNGELQGLRNLNDIIMQSIKASHSQSSPENLAPLLEKDSARRLHFALLSYPVIAHLLHPQSPIQSSDIVPTLLSESIDAVKAAICLFNQTQRQILCDEARRLLFSIDAEETNPQLTPAWNCLRIMENESTTH
ncbi:hypothetical protein [Thioflexithrix psekupsensis]|uniref:Uncharacterized protein n=1 Tax=Thioflexithrix psekupsensis TaxID=1570016 RepID=A0A251XCF0_9GAMM|nr:hypothetical protein [Thioflexithrix psekupsensis]OUD15726.1 hypothetical protein TPSD3_04225 [Thioflexithrix psekupsensis]